MAIYRGNTFIDKINCLQTKALPFGVLKRDHRVSEATLVKDVLNILQGSPGDRIYWDDPSQGYCIRKGTHVSHLSHSSLHSLLRPFLDAATNMHQLERFLSRMSDGTNGKSLVETHPTLQAFLNGVSIRLKHLRKAVLEKELEASSGAAGHAITLLSLCATLSRVCAGADFLNHIVKTVLPEQFFLTGSLDAAVLASNILSVLYNELNRFSLYRDGEEEAYKTLLALFVGSLWPLAQLLNSWLQEGTLDDPFGELFFCANSAVSVNDATFWECGYHFRYHSHLSKESSQAGHDSSLSRSNSNSSSHSLDGDDSTKSGPLMLAQRSNSDHENIACPSFLLPLAKSILSSGKSLQLLRYIQRECANDSGSQAALARANYAVANPATSSVLVIPTKTDSNGPPWNSVPAIGSESGRSFVLDDENVCGSPGETQPLFDEFCTAMKRLLLQVSEECSSGHFLSCYGSQLVGKSQIIDGGSSLNVKGQGMNQNKQALVFDGLLNLGRSSKLCALDDIEMHQAIFGGSNDDMTNNGTGDEGRSNYAYGREAHVFTNADGGNSSLLIRGTDFCYGNGCGKLLFSHMNMDIQIMEKLLSYPTLLPSFEDDILFSDVLQYLRQNKATAEILAWLQQSEINGGPSAVVMVKECLISLIEKQVNVVSKQLLDRLMGKWGLMEELASLRAIYLLGSGDLLQQFCSGLFNKLDRGESWDDFYELNTMLQESVRSSADGMLLPALDALIVTMDLHPNAGKNRGPSYSQLQFMGKNSIFGIDILDNLGFNYKVSWPLELIVGNKSLKKYNQVMGFLLKVKRAKHALDKACRWLWKSKAGDPNYHKQQLLLQMKLMHFVNTLHQYVMDQVLYSAWVELCEGMATAVSLDEVIACHDSYLVSIQRQCFVAPDKLWTLIASRVKTILGLALDYYSIQRALCGGGGSAVAMAAKCQVEIERVGRQFDECMVFLLRVLSFKLNVGHFPHLTDLITRINYNYYYISESGNLLTPVPEAQNLKLTKKF